MRTLLTKNERTDAEPLVDFVLALRKSDLVEFLRERELPRSGAKSNLRAAIQVALDEDRIREQDLLELLDRLTPWDKQHVFLYDGPTGGCDAWRDRQQVRGRLRAHGLDGLLEEPRQTVLPEELTLTTIRHSPRRLRVQAVQRREYTERRPELDRRQQEDGHTLELRAYTHHLFRGLVAFEWDLETNAAMIQIRQLPSSERYEVVAEQLRRLVAPWLDLSGFTPVEVARAVARLHEQAEGDRPEARSHALTYASLGGRRISGTSAEADSALVGGERAVDAALAGIRSTGVAHLGDFYWLPARGPGGNPLTDEVHLNIVARDRRVNLMTPNDEPVVRYVLARIRDLSR